MNPAKIGPKRPQNQPNLVNLGQFWPKIGHVRARSAAPSPNLAQIWPRAREMVPLRHIWPKNGPKMAPNPLLSKPPNSQTPKNPPPCFHCTLSDQFCNFCIGGPKNHAKWGGGGKKWLKVSHSANISRCNRPWDYTPLFADFWAPSLRGR